MNLFHRTTSTRFWIRLRRRTDGPYEAVLSGLTCEDVYDELREEFEGRYLVLFSVPPMQFGSAEELLSHGLRVKFAPVVRTGEEKVFVIPPSDAEKVLRSHHMATNDLWWFFPFPRPITLEDVRLLELQANLRYFWDKPRPEIALFVYSVRDLAVLARDKRHVVRLIQKLFSKYVTGLELLTPEEAAQMDFLRQMEIGLEALDRPHEEELHFTFVPGNFTRIYKDTARDGQRVVYEYVPEAQSFARREVKALRLHTILLENWGAIVVSLSSVILLVGSIVILVCFLLFVVAVILSFFL